MKITILTILKVIGIMLLDLAIFALTKKLGF